MRRMLNILQSVALTYSVIDSTNVHICTGVPLPVEMDNAFKSLLQDQYTTCYAKLDQLRVQNGYSLIEVVAEIHRRLAAISMPTVVRCSLHADLADLEYRVAQGCSEKLQLAGLVGAFAEAREKIK